MHSQLCCAVLHVIYEWIQGCRSFCGAAAGWAVTYPTEGESAACDIGYWQSASSGCDADRQIRKMLHTLLALLIHFISGMQMIRNDLCVLIPGQAGIWTTLSPFGTAQAVVMLVGRWGFAWCEAVVLLPVCACPGCVGVGEENYSLQVRSTQVFLCPAAPQWLNHSPPAPCTDLTLGEWGVPVSSHCTQRCSGIL